MSKIAIRDAFTAALQDDGFVDSKEAQGIANAAIADGALDLDERDELESIYQQLPMSAARAIIRATATTPMQLLVLADVRSRDVLADSSVLLTGVAQDAKTPISIFFDQSITSKTKGTLFVGAPFPRRPMVAAEANVALDMLFRRLDNPFTHAPDNVLIQALAKLAGLDPATVGITSSVPPIGTMRNVGSSAQSLMATPTGFLSVALQRGLKLYDARQRLVGEVAVPADGSWKLPKVAADGVVSMESNGTTHVWDATGAPLMQVADAQSLQVTERGASALRGDNLLILDIDGHEKQVQGPFIEALRLANGDTVVTQFGDKSATLSRYDARGHLEQSRPLPEQGTLSTLSSGKLLLTGQHAYVLDPATGDLLHEVSVDGKRFGKSFPLTDGKLVSMLYTEDKVVGGVVWREDGTVIATYEGAAQDTAAAGSTIASFTDKTLTVRNAAGVQQCVIKSPSRFTSVMVANDRIITTDDSGRVAVWNKQGDELLSVENTTRSPVWAAVSGAQLGVAYWDRASALVYALP